MTNHGKLVIGPITTEERPSWKWEDTAAQVQISETPEPIDITGGRRVTIVAEDGRSVRGLVLDSGVVDAKGGDVLRLVVQLVADP